VGHAVEPVADHLPRSDRRRPADEDEEGGLEGVLGVLVAGEYAAADPPDHRGVPSHEGFQSRPVPAADEALQQFPILQPGFVIPEQDLTKLWDQVVQGAG